MSLEKANKFIGTARESGWQTKWNCDEEHTWFRVTATRGPETLVIEWQNRQLAFSPSYQLHEMKVKVHSTKDAYRLVQAPKPDMDRYVKWQSRQRATNRRLNGEAAAMSEPAENVEYELPFDIHEDEDSTILKAIRGNTIVWRNSISKTVESCFVPYRTSDNKIFNWDLQNVFYLAEGETTGKSYLSFMDSNGQFRAVHLEALIGVV
ncbi:hypothetical protein BI084_gp49 [Gordonia phage Terapin]|uniref:Uncharacterized protein n=5 Tax=Terapinvirus terapin TaxID=2734283 RepID=A0A345MB88_9CAUD|nr:hypothetical protein BI084_gp49 [Gordonia phage Terapin]AVP43325.1 hypothetical protein PBI_DJOKOVIC_48 [Gordonia phage Djokovic]AXH67759.1 hypothetical protein SEA_BEYONCAGE_48 [Gordonia phage Beyoncage]QOC56193.1 hypothetical protein SEA_SIENNA_48 [Gordonia phage Sienna]QOC56618.1 hypothetical protein SEA_BITESIZE_48 [Gordonia phage BiteSize]QYW00851.1 hypothetical protein SEA_MADI_48 [Gordonia phage Madi]